MRVRFPPPPLTGSGLTLVRRVPAGDHAAVAVQPSGTVTFVFTDVEGSTTLLDGLGAEAYRQALAEHHSVLREVFAAHSGYEVDEAGDGLFYAFGSASEAVGAVRQATASLAEGPVRVRIGVHTGEALLDPPKYVGADVHKAARIMSAAHGGQVVLSAATHELVVGDMLELGRHRLKDFAEPVLLYQLGLERFPPLRTISNTNLPVALSSFVGREREVREVVSLVRQDAARLVTLAGPGGTGKTRLALEAAGELVSDFGAGVFWIGLAPIRDPALVLASIAQTLEATQEPAEHIGEKNLLLVLDNLEQVIDSAVELAALLRACPKLCMLVTSRELLRVDGEVVYPVPALAEPEAVALFCARARVESDEDVAELCSRLDNLPLALELAAARVSVLTPAQILERISQRLDLFRAGRGADPRQQTLRTTIEWSFELLTDEEKLLFTRLGVFRGGCTLEAAEQVVEADLDTLQSLVDKNLLRHSGERFWMLQTIREYARELLEQHGESNVVRRQHAAHYLGLAEAAYAGRSDPWAGLVAAARRGTRQPSLRARFPARARLPRLPPARRGARLVLGDQAAVCGGLAAARGRAGGTRGRRPADRQGAALARRSRVVQRAVRSGRESPPAGDRDLARLSTTSPSCLEPATSSAWSSTAAETACRHSRCTSRTSSSRAVLGQASLVTTSLHGCLPAAAGNGAVRACGAAGRRAPGRSLPRRLCHAPAGLHACRATLLPQP